MRVDDDAGAAAATVSARPWQRDRLDVDVQAALPDRNCGENAPRLLINGRTHVLDALDEVDASTASRREVMVCSAGEVCAVEFAETQTDGVACSAVFAFRSGGGSTTRILGFRHAFVPMAQPATRANIHLDRAEGAIRSYLDHLEAGRVQATVECFSEDAIYSFGPRTNDGDREIVVGHAQLRSVFEQRGVNSARHRIDRVVPSESGSDFAVVGRVVNLPGDASAAFLSCATLDPAGRIRRYVAQLCVPNPFAPGTF